MRGDPAARARARHTAHRGPLRRHLAPPGLPPGAAAERARVGVAWDDRGRALARRRRRRLHRQPLRRPAARQRRSRRGHASTTTSPRARSGTSSNTATTIACASCNAQTSATSTTLTTVMRGHDAVIHLASNPDIARAAVEPTIDFDQGTVLTQNVVEAMRVTDDASGSSTRPAAACTATSVRPRSTRTAGRCCRSRPTARASSPARR